MKYPIYIPSKGRDNNCLTAELLNKYNLFFYLVVEPQDFNKYKIRYGNKVIKMPKNNMGIAYARNFCKQDSITRGYNWHWQVDDNIKYFGVRENNKNIKINPKECFSIIEHETLKYNNIGISGMKHHVFAFSASNDYSINRQCYSSVFINNDIDVYWRGKCVEDTDYSLQILFSGFCTILFNRVLMWKEDSLKMSGGNTEIEYSGNGRLIRSEGLQKLWPGIFEIGSKKNGAITIKPSRIWSKFKQRPLIGDNIIKELNLF